MVADVAVEKKGEFRRFQGFHFLARARAFVSNFPGTKSLLFPSLYPLSLLSNLYHFHGSDSYEFRFHIFVVSTNGDYECRLGFDGDVLLDLT